MVDSAFLTPFRRLLVERYGRVPERIDASTLRALHRIEREPHRPQNHALPARELPLACPPRCQGRGQDVLRR